MTLETLEDEIRAQLRQSASDIFEAALATFNKTPVVEECPMLQDVALAHYKRHMSQYVAAKLRIRYVNKTWGENEPGTISLLAQLKQQLVYLTNTKNVLRAELVARGLSQQWLTSIHKEITATVQYDSLRLSATTHSASACAVDSYKPNYVTRDNTRGFLHTLEAHHTHA